MGSSTGGSGGRPTWRLGRFTFVRRADLRSGERVVEVIPPFWMDRWTNDSSLAAVIQRLLQPTSVAGMLSALAHDPTSAPKLLRNALNEAVMRREIVLLKEDDVATASTDGGGTNPGSAAAAASQRKKKNKPPPPVQKTEKTWVEFRLVNQDNKPMRGASYRLKITDGSVREGTLDDAGSVRVPNLDPGMCEISFLSYDQKEWKRI